MKPTFIVNQLELASVASITAPHLSAVKCGFQGASGQLTALLEDITCIKQNTWTDKSKKDLLKHQLRSFFKKEKLEKSLWLKNQET